MGEGEGGGERERVGEKDLELFRLHSTKGGLDNEIGGRIFIFLGYFQ